VSSDTRGQSNVVGVAILLGVTVLALGTVTASVGTLIETNAAAADANRVAADLDDAIQPVRTTGTRVGAVSFTDGTLATESRTVRVLNESGTVFQRDAGAVRFQSGSYRVTALAGAITAGAGDGRFTRSPPISVGDGVLVVGVPVLSGSLDASGETHVRVRTRVTHDRRTLGSGQFRVAVETRRPGPWEDFFERENATVSHRDFDGDGVESVVAAFPGNRTGYVVVHRVEVSTDG